MSLLQRFGLACFAAVVLFGLGFGWVTTRALERHELARSREFTAAFVVEEVRKEFRPEELTEPLVGVAHEAFRERLATRTLGPNVVRVKVWAPDGTVLWSDEPSLVGQRFPQNDDLARAVGGQVVAELSHLDRAENASESTHGRLLELYVPVRFEGVAGVHAVFEVYQSLEPLYRDVARQRRLVWTATAVGLGGLYAALFGIVWGASRRLDARTQELARSEDRYRSLVESARDAVVSVDRKGGVVLFNRAAERVFGCDAAEGARLRFLDLVALPHRVVVGNAVDELLTGHAKSVSPRLEVQARRCDGQGFPAEFSLSSSGAGTGRLVTAIVRDLTEREAMHNRLVQAERQATVSVMASSIGHE
ncbi:MAG: PAS domain S-box protein, partial [Deferrisomatales bacterium]